MLLLQCFCCRVLFELAYFTVAKALCMLYITGFGYVHDLVHTIRRKEKKEKRGLGQRTHNSK